MHMLYIARAEYIQPPPHIFHHFTEIQLEIAWKNIYLFSSGSALCLGSKFQGIKIKYK